MNNHDNFLESVNQNAERLLNLYREQKSHIQFKKQLKECLDNEHLKLEELRMMYRDELRSVKFLKASYFRDHSSFDRHQDIPAKYFSTMCPRFLFISHRWDTFVNPDPNKKQFDQFKSYFDSFPEPEREYCGYWYDYSCVPQPDADGELTEDEKIQFVSVLKVIHLLAFLSHTVILFSDGYLDRSWCCTEWMCATSISPLLSREDDFIPFGNAIKFRHLALVLLYLAADKSVKQGIIDGKDEMAIAFLNSLLARTIESTEATYSSDKLFLSLALHRHFWYHVRFLGLRSQMMIGFLTLQKYDESFIRDLFAQVLFLSRDVEMKWIKEARIDIDTMLLDSPDNFQDLIFHGKKIQVTSNAEFKSNQSPDPAD